MAWNDGSRFLIAHGVAWGKGPKVYKGSTRDTDWNKDLLWKLYVESEAKKHGVKIRMPEDHGPQAIANSPPFMQSLTAATTVGVPNVPFVDPYRDNPTKSDHKPKRGGHHHDIDRSKLRSGHKHAAQAAPHGASAQAMHGNTGRAALRSAGARSFVHSPVSQRQAARLPQGDVSARTFDRLQQLEQMVKHEQRARQDLQRKVEHERQARLRAEQTLARVKGGGGGGGGGGYGPASTRSRATDTKLQAYETIMSGLVSALKDSSRRRK